MMSTNKETEKSPFVLEQLDEALEERQNPDRRQTDPSGFGGTDRRKGDRRDTAASEAKH